MAVNEKNMTSGSPGKLIITFAIPLMLGNVFQQFYTMADTMIVGQVVGVEALAAVGAADWWGVVASRRLQGVGGMECRELRGREGEVVTGMKKFRERDRERRGGGGYRGGEKRDKEGGEKKLLTQNGTVYGFVYAGLASLLSSRPRTVLSLRVRRFRMLFMGRRRQTVGKPDLREENTLCLGDRVHWSERTSGSESADR